VNQKSRPAVTPKGKTTKRSLKQNVWTAVAFVFMLGFLAGLGLRIVGGDRTTHYTGPDHMTASAENIFVHAAGHLWVLTHLGDSVLHLTPERLQLEGEVIDLRVMPDGRLLIAERQPARISLCDTATWICQPTKLELKKILKRQFKVAPAADGHTLFITDSTRGGALYRADLTSGRVKPILENELSYANDIQIDSDGLLWIADSKNRRIVRLSVDGDKASITGIPYTTQNKAAQKTRTWPMMLQPMADGEWAVTQPTDAGGRADILIYNKDLQREIYRLALDASLGPTDLTLANGWLLASDIEGYSLYTLDPRDSSNLPWGDATINDWLKLQRAERDKYEGWVSGGLIIMILCAPFMLVAGYYATPHNKRKNLFDIKAGPMLTRSDAALPPLSGTYWLKRNKKMDLLFRFLAPAMTVLVIGILGGMGYLIYQGSEDLAPERLEKLMTVYFLLSLVLIGLLPMLYLNIGIVRGQLGTDGQRIYVRYPNGSQGSAPLNKLVFGKLLLHFGRHTVSVGAQKRQALYEPGEVEHYIWPLLKDAKKVGAFGLLARQLAAGEIGPIYTWFYVFGMIGATIYLEFFIK